MSLRIGQILEACLFLWIFSLAGLSSLQAQTTTYTWTGATNTVWRTGNSEGNWEGGSYAPGNGGGNNFVFTAPSNTRTLINLTGGHNPNVNHMLINGNTPVLTIAINAATESSKMDLTALSEGANTITVTGGSTTIQTVGDVGTNLNAGMVELQGFNTQTWDIQGSATLTINALIRGTNSTRGFIKTGTGTLVLGGANTYSGKTTINGGTLRIDDESRLGPNPGTAAANHFSLNDATLQTTESFNFDDSNRGITLGSLGGTFSPDEDTTLTISKAIVGTGALTKAGIGSLALNTANTYTGNTIVSSGELILTNTSGSATGTGNVLVNGGVLRGTGIVVPAANGSITVASGALLSIGLGTDTLGKKLTFGSSSIATTLTLKTGSVFEVDLFSGAGSGNNSVTSSSADLLVWKGTLNIESGVTLRINNPNGMSSFAANDTWRLFDWTTLSGSVPVGTFDNALAQLPTLGGGLTWDLSQLYTSGTISIVLVPEPGRCLFCIVGLGWMLMRRNRRR